LLGDDLLLATWLTGGDGKLTMTRRFQLVRVSDKSTLMRGQWDLVCIELTSGKARRMPPEFCDVYNAAVIAQ
jgi:acyl-CoA thioester hydrolase